MLLGPRPLPLRPAVWCGGPSGDLPGAACPSFAAAEPYSPAPGPSALCRWSRAAPASTAETRTGVTPGRSDATLNRRRRAASRRPSRRRRPVSVVPTPLPRSRFGHSERFLFRTRTTHSLDRDVPRATPPCRSSGTRAGAIGPPGGSTPLAAVAYHCVVHDRRPLRPSRASADVPGRDALLPDGASHEGESGTPSAVTGPAAPTAPRSRPSTSLLIRPMEDP